MSIKHKLQHGRWIIRRSIWPYEDGWGTYHPRSMTVLDTGLTKVEAERRCDKLNDGDYS